MVQHHGSLGRNHLLVDGVVEVGHLQTIKSIWVLLCCRAPNELCPVVPATMKKMSGTAQHRLREDCGTIDHNNIKYIHQWFNTFKHKAGETYNHI